MAGSAMRQSFDEIGPTVPFGGSLTVLGCLAIREVQQRPEIHERTHRQHEHAGIFLIGGGHGRDAHVVGIKRVNVVRRREMAEDIGHCRIEIALVRRDAIPYYAMEVGTRIVADAMLFVRRDVGRIKHTERRRYRQPAGAPSAPAAVSGIRNSPRPWPVRGRAGSGPASVRAKELLLTAVPRSMSGTGQAKWQTPPQQ